MHAAAAAAGDRDGHRSVRLLGEGGCYTCQLAAAHLRRRVRPIKSAVVHWSSSVHSSVREVISTMNSLLVVGLLAAVAVVANAGDYPVAYRHNSYAFHGYYPGIARNFHHKLYTAVII
jgi:hypothetical protein